MASANETCPELVTGIRDYFLIVFIPVFAVQWIFWIISYVLKTEKMYDLVGAGTYLYVVISRGFWFAGTSTVTQLIQAVCVACWCLRLGGFLFYRVIKTGQDRRFEEIRVSLIKFFGAWTAQGFWITITTLPSIFMWWCPGLEPVFEARHAVGFAIFALAWLFEVVADFQKLGFKNNPKNQGKFIRSGLWSISRHPNYFGEIVLWFGLFISASVTFPSYWCYFAILCPLWDMALIVGLSGVPMLEASAEKKWGGDPEYRDYVRRVACLVPFLPCLDGFCTPKVEPIAADKPAGYESVET